MATKSNATLTTLYYLLFAQYGSTPIKSDYPQQWKDKIFSTIFMYAPAWAKRLDIQDAVRALTDDEIVKGSASIYNNAANPDTTPSTDTWDTLQGINSQNVTLHKRGKLEGYAMVDSLLKTDVTKEFIDRFKKYFIQVVTPGRPLWYDWSDTFPAGGDLDAIIGDPTVPLFGNYMTETFEEMFPSVTAFIDDYKASGIPVVLPEV